MVKIDQACKKCGKPFRSEVIDRICKDYKEKKGK